jgi:hypothetical protein
MPDTIEGRPAVSISFGGERGDCDVGSDKIKIILRLTRTSKPST